MASDGVFTPEQDNVVVVVAVLLWCENTISVRYRLMTLVSGNPSEPGNMTMGKSAQ